MFLTGRAGSGKTFLLNSYVNYLREKKIGVAVTASTGIAATHIDGMTIHSWSGIGIHDSLSPDMIHALADSKRLRDRFIRTEVLIIDEVSMLRGVVLDMLNAILKSARSSFDPFGGMQVILCGDFFQLPPVVPGDNSSDHFAFKSSAWREMSPKICYLTTQFRQSEGELLSILNDIREASVDADTVEKLRARHGADINGKDFTRLYSHNVNVDAINSTEISKIASEAHSYNMETRGAKKIAADLKRSCLAPEELVLKVGAVVMFLRNNFEKGYANGTLGTVVAFDEEGNPVVETRKGKKISVLSEAWRLEENGKLLAEIRQLPLRLAWAITVHKSQGMSLDAAEIDLSRAFEPGMGYVALSRVRSIDGLRLVGINEMALRVHPEILALEQELVAHSEMEAEILKNMPEEKIEKEPQKTEAQEEAYDEELFNKLRSLRRTFADARKIPAYVVFADKALQEMARRMPKNEQELLRIKGVGSKKLADFGEVFLALINDYKNTSK